MTCCEPGAIEGKGRKAGGIVRVNPQYSLVTGNSLASKIAGQQRRRMYEVFLRETAIQPHETVLDVGVTGEHTYSHSNPLVQWYPYKDRITASGVDDAGFLEAMFPGVKFVRADGRSLPFADRQFDYVHSNATVEHVGSREKQAIFLRETWRVARKGIFVTTPNRWFPVEMHTQLPFAHWLPAAAFRRICRGVGMSFFANEENLNLLTSSELKLLAQKTGIEQIKVRHVALYGWPSNLLLIARRDGVKISD